MPNINDSIDSTTYYAFLVDKNSNIRLRYRNKKYIPKRYLDEGNKGIIQYFLDKNPEYRFSVYELWRDDYEQYQRMKNNYKASLV